MGPNDVTVVMDVAHPQPIQGSGNLPILNFLYQTTQKQNYLGVVSNSYQADTYTTNTV